MADNTTLNPGTGGDVIATDDLGGGVKVQRVKVQVGADGAAADVHADSPLPNRGDHASRVVSGAITAASSFATIGYTALNATVPAAGTFQEIDTTALSAVIVTVTGTWTAGTINLEATADGTNWFTVHGLVPGPTNNSVLFAFTTQGYLQVNVTTYAKLRARAINTVTGLSGVSVHMRGTASAAIVATPTRVIGSVAVGVASNDNPILIAGRDPTNKVQVVPASMLGIAALSLREAVMAGTVTGVYGRSAGQVTLAALGRAAVRNSTFAEQTSGAQRAFKSSSALDTALGTGVRSITIVYYTLTAGVVAGPFFETKATNGVAAVTTTATNIAYIEAMYPASVGSGGVAAGNIDLTVDTLGLGTVMARIATGSRGTEYAHHYVANGGSCLISGVHFSCNETTGNESNFEVTSRDPTNANSPQTLIASGLIAQGSTGTRFLDVHRSVNGPAIIEAYVTPTTTGKIHRFEFSFVEV